MSDAPSAFPLAWPAHRPRTPLDKRQNGKFRSKGADLTVAVAAGRVEDEVDRLGGKYLLISSNVELTLSGRPRSSQPEPSDRGVCIYFQLAGRPYAMACDRYITVADNLAAIAAHIDATRAIERHGVATAAETLQAFMALAAPGGRHWTTVLNLPQNTTANAVRQAHRRLLVERHPDRGGTDAEAAEINAARDQALKDLGE